MCISVRTRPCWRTYPETVIKQHVKESIMGKYFLGWLLGVPAIVLVLLYLVFH
jgi:hypothetical protein